MQILHSLPLGTWAMKNTEDLRKLVEANDSPVFQTFAAFKTSRGAGFGLAKKDGQKSATGIQVNRSQLSTALRTSALPQHLQQDQATTTDKFLGNHTFEDQFIHRLKIPSLQARSVFPIRN